MIPLLPLPQKANENILGKVDNAGIFGLGQHLISVQIENYCR